MQITWSRVKADLYVYDQILRMASNGFLHTNPADAAGNIKLRHKNVGI